MTPTERAIVEAISELSVAVQDLHYHLSAESRDAGEEATEDLRQRAELLTSCGHSLVSAQHRLRMLGSDCLK
jgi:hypothetical protein